MRYQLEIGTCSGVLRFAEWGSSYEEARKVLRLARTHSRERITITTVIDMDTGEVLAEFRYGRLAYASTHAQDVLLSLY